MKLAKDKFSIRTADGWTRISIFISEDQELAEKLIEKIQEIEFDHCENCGRLFISNSPTHRICWRCR